MSAAVSATGWDAQIAALDPWFQNLELHGRQTAPEHPLGDYPGVKWRRLAPLLPDLRGKSVLDIGCNAGFYALECLRLGAARVVGLEVDPRYRAQARLAQAATGLAFPLLDLSVYEVAELGERFDVVFFLGVLYHLRHPLLALDLIWEHACAEHLVFQSMLRGEDAITPVAGDYAFEDETLFQAAGMPRLTFIEHKFAGDETNWWAPNRACAEAMLRSAGFRVRERAGEDMYLCARGERPWDATLPGAGFP